MLRRAELGWSLFVSPLGLGMPRGAGAPAWVSDHGECVLGLHVAAMQAAHSRSRVLAHAAASALPAFLAGVCFKYI